MVIDISRCMRCYGCIVACRVEHFLPVGIDWPRLVAVEIDNSENEFFHSTYPVRCNQCREALCLEVCPTGATYQRQDGIIAVNQHQCVGCRYCVIACPYQNRSFLSGNKDKGFFPKYGLTEFEKAGKKLYPHEIGTTEKCNFCMERIDAGLAKGLTPGIDREATPACVKNCQARAIAFGDLEDPESKVSILIQQYDGFQLHPEFGTDPSIFYIDRSTGKQSNPVIAASLTSDEVSISAGVK